MKIFKIRRPKVDFSLVFLMFSLSLLSCFSLFLLVTETDLERDQWGSLTPPFFQKKKKKYIYIYIFKI
jgi:hypothetical protein